MSLSPTIRDLTATVAVTICAALALAACGSVSTVHTSPGAARALTPSVAPRSGRVMVSISGYAFHPATITVRAGTKVTFTNHDQTAHTATSSGSGFDTGTVAPGRSATVTLRRPGTYSYVCQFHPFMRGTIVVRGPGSSAPAGS